MLIDCLYPFPEYPEMIERGLRSLELNPEDICAVVLTHGHFDHFGRADYFRDRYGATIYMSRTDYEAFNPEVMKHGPNRIHFTVENFIGEGDVLTFGGTSIHVFETPGHSPGSLSFIFNVTDEGRPHTICTWGGSGLPVTRGNRKLYAESARRFAQVCREYGVDAEFANHPFVDMSLPRYEICRSIIKGVANPFVIGNDAIARYVETLAQMAEDSIAQMPEE